MSRAQQIPPNSLGHYAGFVTRLAARLVDQGIIALINFVVMIGVEWVLRILVERQLLFGWEQVPLPVLSGIAAGVYTLISFGYDIAFWTLAGQTPGKRLMGVRVVRTDGQRLRFGGALLRRLGYLLSGLLYLGFLWVLMDNRRQGWHDKLARTIVVYTWPEEELRGTMVRDGVQKLLAEQQAARRDG
jgi:uncharacterized RDD family membrane protein YckC